MLRPRIRHVAAKITLMGKRQTAREGLSRYSRRPFESLSVYNYRLYFIGQGISLSGTWLQLVAQTWLVLELTHSGTQLGILSAVQFLPILLFGAYGGVIADRFVKRRLLYFTQCAFMLLAFALAVLVLTHAVQVWMVYVIAIAFGFVQMVDSPTRQTFIMEMVGGERLTNAVSLNSIEVNVARVIGPLFAAALIAGLGIGWCFLINGLSFIAVLGCLRLMRGNELYSKPPVASARGQLMEGFRYIWRTPVLRNVLLMMALMGALTYEFQVVLPVFATNTFHGSARTFAAMMAAMGAGSLFGGLITAGRGNPSPKRLLRAALVLGLSLLFTAASPTFWVALIFLFSAGFWSIGVTALTNSTLQLNSSPEMRGRVMSLWVVAFLGSTPIGGPIIGYISERTSPRAGLMVGGLAAVFAASFGLLAVRQYRRKQVGTAAPQATATIEDI